MPSATVTLTGKVGQGDTMTAQTLSDVVGVNFRIADSMVEVARSAGKIVQMDFSGTTTITFTVSGTGVTKASTLSVIQ